MTKVLFYCRVRYSDVSHSGVCLNPWDTHTVASYWPVYSQQPGNLTDKKRMSSRIQSQNKFIMNQKKKRKKKSWAESATFTSTNSEFWVCVRAFSLWRPTHCGQRKMFWDCSHFTALSATPGDWPIDWEWARRTSLAFGHKNATSKEGWLTRSSETAYWLHSQSVSPSLSLQSFPLSHLIGLLIFQSHSYMSLY